MKISQEEIDAANYALGELMEAPLDEAVMEHALIAALKVRRARKQAKRERQRKEKDKHVVESVKPAAVSAFLKDGETVLDRLQRGQRDEVMLMKLLAEEKLKTEALTKMNADQIKHMTERFLGWKLPENFHPDGGITFKATFNENTPHPMKAEPVGTNLFDYSQAKAMVEYMIEGLPISSATPSKAPEWDGKFGIGEWEMRDGQKQVIYEIDPNGGIYPLNAVNGLTYTKHGENFESEERQSDLIRPWPKGEQ